MRSVTHTLRVEAKPDRDKNPYSNNRMEQSGERGNILINTLNLSLTQSASELKGAGRHGEGGRTVGKRLRAGVEARADAVGTGVSPVANSNRSTPPLVDGL